MAKLQIKFKVFKAKSFTSKEGNKQYFVQNYMFDNDDDAPAVFEKKHFDESKVWEPGNYIADFVTYAAVSTTTAGYKNEKLALRMLPDTMKRI